MYDDNNMIYEQGGFQTNPLSPKDALLGTRVT